VEQKIYTIDEIRARFEQKRKALSCCCDARRIADEFLGNELSELRRTVRRPNVLCLENLDYGVPSIAGGWDLVYSTGLLTGLPLIAARQVLKTALFRVKPGGRMIVANLLADARLTRCPSCRINTITGRTEFQMVELTQDLRPDLVGGQLVFKDEAGLNVYLELHKSTLCPAAGGDETEADRASLECVIRTAV